MSFAALGSLKVLTSQGRREQHVLKLILKIAKTKHNSTKNPTLQTKTPPNISTPSNHYENSGTKKGREKKLQKLERKNISFFHLSVQCQNVILILPALRKSKEDSASY